MIGQKRVVTLGGEIHFMDVPKFDSINSEE
jgi:hypothetical protein